MDPEIFQYIRERGLESMGKFYATYLGVVKTLKDPLELNRVGLYIPEVVGVNGINLWAIAKGSFSGKGYGVQVMPRVGDMVWVSFRHGHPRYPLWEHGNFGEEEKPEDFKELDTYGFITPGGIKVLLKDSDASIQVETPDGNKLTVKDEDTSIKLENKDGTLLDIKGKEILTKDGHLTKAEELKELLEGLQEHLSLWSTAIQAKVSIGIGQVSVPPDPGLTQWRTDLKKFLSKWS